jgi:uncharacterized protein YjbJ (UPF0337 family)
MSLFDKAKEALSNNSDKVGEGVDKASEFAKSRFDGQDDKIDQASGKVKDYLGKQAGGDQPGQ